MHKQTYKIALGGIISALSVAVLFFGSIIPFATFVSPALASMCVLYFCLEYNQKTASLIYVVIGILSALLAPDKEQALLFLFLLGYYPIAKQLFDKLRSKTIALVCKLLLCNVSMLSLYYIITRVFVIEAVKDEFAQYTKWILIALVVLGNFTFLIYDAALTRLSIYYIVKIKPRLLNGRH